MNPTLVLLPGLDGTATLFEPLLDVLPPWLRALPVAYPPAEVLLYADLERYVEARLPAGPFVLVGESFSGPVALRIAAKAPPGLVGVVLTASFVRSQLPRWLGGVAAILFRLPPPRPVIRRLLVGKAAPEALVASVQRALAGVAAPVLTARLREVIDVDASDALRETAVPVLYLQGTADRLVAPEVSELVVRARPDVHRVRIDGPHLLLQRNPRDAAEEIEIFVRACLETGETALGATM